MIEGSRKQRGEKEKALRLTYLNVQERGDKALSGQRRVV